MTVSQEEFPSLPRKRQRQAEVGEDVNVNGYQHQVIIVAMDKHQVIIACDQTSCVGCQLKSKKD